ncbi:hypothetical protein [Coleofasciculus sp.]|uniref:hypothetical protein n=1 Tax=Coleofasciculus sp. TaxID=3100458 RepID=UPI003A11850F
MSPPDSGAGAGVGCTGWGLFSFSVCSWGFSRRWIFSCAGKPDTRRSFVCSLFDLIWGERRVEFAEKRNL